MALVLSRHPGERLVIGGDVVLTVVSVKGDKVRLAIEAPKNVSVYREELLPAAVVEAIRAAAKGAVRE